MSSYIGKHAEFYDLFYAEKPYQQEAAFIHFCLQSYGGGVRRLLELACGTGNHAFELEKFGYAIVATDYSKDMLACAQKKARMLSSEVDFRIQDMRDLNLDDPPFDAAICLFDSIGYTATNDAILGTLRGVHQCIREDGLFIFEFWHAAPMIRNYEPLRIKQFQTEEGQVLRISETKMDYQAQLAHVVYTIFDMHRDGHYQMIKETQTNRYFLVQEMRHFLADSGFEDIKWFAGFQNKEEISAGDWHLVVVAKKVKKHNSE